MNTLRPYSFIILSYNDELHLSRLFDSVKGLESDIYVLDSGSTDRTLEICKDYEVEVSYHPFENHPKQWHVALHRFPINTPWVIALDADQIVSDALYQQLKNFNSTLYEHVNGIYFNRKNFYKGKWIRHGGYFPFYMLKMFRLKYGVSDLNENMDHRFLITGKTIIWKQAYLLEENLKESKVSFWIEKHNRYSDQLALEEVERMRKLRTQIIKPRFWGSPNERKAYMKRLWWKLPRYLRPALYFSYRMTFQLGLLDGKTGIIFHFLQAFWFRLIVDVKIEELLKQNLYESSALTRQNHKAFKKSKGERGLKLKNCQQLLQPEKYLTLKKHICKKILKQENYQEQLENYKASRQDKKRTGLLDAYLSIAGSIPSHKTLPHVTYFKELRFTLLFLSLFACTYGFNIAVIGITAPGGIYVSWADEHLNYIRSWRNFDIKTTCWLLKLLGHQVYADGQSVLVPGYAGFKLVYSCLGYGVMSFFVAFTLAFPKNWKSKALIILSGLLLIQTLNILRFTLIALLWKKPLISQLPDHHSIFNMIIYLVIITILYLWTKPRKESTMAA